MHDDGEEIGYVNSSHNGGRLNGGRIGKFNKTYRCQLSREKFLKAYPDGASHTSWQRDQATASLLSTMSG